MPSPRDLAASRLEQKIDDLTESLGQLRTIAATIQNNQEQFRLAASASVIRADGQDARLTLIEAWKNRLEGAATAGKIVWLVVIAVVGAAAEWLTHKVVH